MDNAGNSSMKMENVKTKSAEYVPENTDIGGYVNYTPTHSVIKETFVDKNSPVGTWTSTETEMDIRWKFLKADDEAYYIISDRAMRKLRFVW